MNHKLDDIDDRDLVAEVASRMARSRAAGDWVDGFELLTSDEAALIAECSTETVRRRAAAAAANGRRIGRQFATIWIISLSRLLDHIECTEGKPARLAAQTRAEKLSKTRSSPQLSSQNMVTATREAGGRV